MANPISTQELEVLVGEVVAGQSSAVLAEVLPRSHFDRGHIPGAVNLPLQDFEAHARQLLPGLDKTVVVYCASAACGNSHLAAQKLTALGYQNVRVFAGGKAAWTETGHSLEVA